jgi:ABC-type microcin C transport system duplicated ATPase subunit YejF
MARRAIDAFSTWRSCATSVTASPSCTGAIVEWGDGDQVTSALKHPYTQQLFLSAPIPDPARQAERREALLALKERNLEGATGGN